MTTSKIPPKPSAVKTAVAPKHFAAREKQLWREFVTSHRFEDSPSLTLLTTTLEAHARMRRCREQIDKDGEAVTDRWGQIKSHPLLSAERDARSSFLAGLRALHLDLGGTA